MSFDKKFQQIDKFITEKWEHSWNLSTTGLKYRCTYVKMLKKPLMPILPRSKETLITRLRLQHCLLNNNFKTLGLHPTGLCIRCGIPETVEHFLTQSKNNEELINTMKNIAMNSNAEFDLKWILSNEDIFGIIYDYV